jgi:hypothetical protein
MQFKMFFSNIKSSFTKLDTLLAWLAIFLWVTDWTWRYTNLDGVTNLVFHRLPKWDWSEWKPIVGGGGMTGVSVFYWAGVVAVVITSFLLVRKLFSKTDADIVESLNKTLKENNKELADVLTKNNQLLLDSLTKIIVKGVKNGKRTKSDSNNIRK